MDGYSILQKVCVAGINILFSNSDNGRHGKRNNCIRGFRISEYRHCRPDNSTLADIIDNHASQKSRIVTVRADKPWYTAELSLEKRLRGKYERKWKKMNWIETTLKHHWIHQRIKFQTVFPYFVVSPSNNFMLFLKLISERLLAHHQRNRAPLTRSLHRYSNNVKTNCRMFLQLL